MRQYILLPVLFLSLVVDGCALTQQPASVSDSHPTISATMPPSEIKPTETRLQAPASTPASPISGQGRPMAQDIRTLNELPMIARALRKEPQAVKTYRGQKLHGQARFVKTAKGNPNAVVADVRVTGIGEVSLWCRNVLGAAPTGRVGAFEGTLTANVYTSEDFSHDVFLRDCRFLD